MRKIYGIGLLFLLAISFSTFAEEQKEKLTDKAKKIVIPLRPDEQKKQEYIEVRGDALAADLAQVPLADQLADYQSKNTRELMSPVDLLLFHTATDWNRDFDGRPHKSQNFVEVKVPQ